MTVPTVPIGVEVSTTDCAAVGESWCLIVDPVERRATHIVVREYGQPSGGWLVRLNQVQDAGPDGIRLHIDHSRLRAQRPYHPQHFVAVADPSLFPYDPAVAWPYTTTAERVPPDARRVRKGGVPVYRGAEVCAYDGERVGRIDQFVVDEQDGCITHMVLREHHHRCDKELVVPLAEIAAVEDGTVRLRLYLEELGQLPDVPVHRPPRPDHTGATSMHEETRHDPALRPADPKEEGLPEQEPDATRVEGARILADQAADVLMSRGFTREEIRHWAEQYVTAEGSGDVDGLVSWIREHEARDG